MRGATPRCAAYHLGEGRALKTVCGKVWREATAYHLGEGRALKTHVGECRARVPSVSPWGRARTQDPELMAVIDQHSVSPWGRARTQDSSPRLTAASTSVSPWGRARTQDHRARLGRRPISVSPWGRARTQDYAGTIPWLRCLGYRFERCRENRATPF